jgi:hypothetical protein
MKKINELIDMARKAPSMLRTGLALTAVFCFGLLAGRLIIDLKRPSAPPERQPVTETGQHDVEAESTASEQQNPAVENDPATTEPTREETAAAAAETWKSRLVSRAARLTIDWRPSGKMVSAANDPTIRKDSCDPDPYCQPQGEVWIGTVSGGPYDGYRLTSEAFENGEGMSYTESFYFLIPPSEAQPRVMLNRYRDAAGFRFGFADPTTQVVSEAQNYVAGEFPNVEFETTAVIPEFEHQKLVRSADGSIFELLGLSGAAGDGPWDTGDCLRIDIRGADGDLYSCGSGAYFKTRPDGRTVNYDLQLPFHDVTGFIRYDGQPVTGTYTKETYGGCGQTTVNTFVNEADIGDVFPFAVLKDGITGSIKVTLYAPSVMNDVGTAVEQAFNTWNAPRDEENRVSLEKFMAMTPVLFYRNVLGEWLEFKSTEIMPMAECGKPVIYLYPPSMTDIEVRLTPQGGFTASEPEYRDGWRVTAAPDGSLVNRDDGRSYPYLFWEGRGGMYAPPDKYWVVPRGEVPSFLDRTLKGIGLNDRETSDFLEFWLPRMTAAPYYKIGFHGTDVMNQIAPMQISVAPDSVLRILMDYEELEKPAPSNPPAYRTFRRQGFTAVEWGGVIRE